jgi:hypothetical protein
MGAGVAKVPIVHNTNSTVSLPTYIDPYAKLAIRAMEKHAAMVGENLIGK